ncbi:DNA-binding protein [Comamonas denitrificans]|uniref:DNA-binding protein n=1 Tax=Comamonas denitrificans TaxID=117506 RepID=A0A939KDJ9_9BURK|nr:DNA-binding protein [Comamonas denitrificans]MBO1249439.1 DNA-binding protein [Comamonas denitrificans]
MEFQNFDAVTGSYLPPVLGVTELSVLLHKSPGVILADRVRAPHRLPPCCTPPGTRQPLWILQDVLDWLRQFQKQPAPAPVKKRQGRPTKREQLERQQAKEAAAAQQAQGKGGAA